MNETADASADTTTPRVAERLSRAIRIPTISARAQQTGSTPAFAQMRDFITHEWAEAAKVLDVEVHAGSLLMTWTGSSSALADAPVLFMAHQDVVGITGIEAATATPDSTSPSWEVPPFAGQIRDGAVWGRGALDDKGSLCALMEAVDRLAGAGHTPRRTLMFAFGCDEEQVGASAQAVVEVLEERGVRPWMVLDEGGAVVDAPLPGLSGRVAVVGVSEKGTVDLRLHVEDAGGHASTPPRRGATWRLARAITRIERHPFPAHLTEPVVAMLEQAAPRASGPLAKIYAHARSTRAVLARVLVNGGPESAAMVHTTVAVTELSGSAGLNVLATSATAGLNVRVAVGETVKGMLSRLHTVIDDPDVRIEVVAHNEPSPVSQAEGPQWEMLRAALAASHPDALLLPYIQLSASDSRHFTSLSSHVYRFTPFDMSAEERGTIHGNDERIRVTSLADGVDFYESLMKQL